MIHKWVYRHFPTARWRKHQFHCVKFLTPTEVSAIQSWLEKTFGYDKSHYLRTHGGTNQLYETSLELISTEHATLFKLRWSAG